MPRPTPVKIAPPTMPRRAVGTWASTVGAASTISTPPARPAEKRQAENQANDSGAAQARNAAVASSIMARSTTLRRRRAASGRADSAPAR